MKPERFAKLANYDQSLNSHKIITDSLDKLIRALGIINGSVKIYVHQGKWGERIEIQQQVCRNIIGESKAR